MNIEDFFSDKSQETEKKDQKKTKLAVIDSFLMEPAVQNLSADFNIIREKPAVCAEKLLQGIVNSALITTIDYAKGKGSWKLIPDFCVSCKGPFRNINLFFNKEIRDLNKIAVDFNDETAHALLKIVLQEKYELSPELISMNGSLSDKLNSVDAVLVSGDDAFNIQKSNKTNMDLGDEWHDLTGLPFVYGLWAVHEMGLITSITKNVQNITDKSIYDSDQVSKQLYSKYGQDAKVYSEHINNSISYHMGLEEKEAINEFLRYAFFFGLIEHIPELHFI